MLPERLRPTRTGLLASTAIGVYVLLIAGATASLADAAAACQTWPGCTGSLTEPTVLIALGHRIAAAIVGLLVLWTAYRVLRSDATRRVRATVAVAVALYPVQVGIGAIVSLTGATAPAPGLHLAVGVGIFGGFVLTLAWHLESETASDDRVATDLSAPEPPAEPTDDGVGDSPGPALAEQSLPARLRARAAAYARLTKPRLMWLLCLVAAAGMALAAGPALTLRTIVLTLGGGVLAIGASGTFNHVIERDRDKHMDRTSDRPVATHQVPARRALLFGITLAALSVGIFWQVNALAAALGLVAILFYSVIYTVVLKPNTVQNTVIGGAAGALPAMIGWAAVTGKVGLPGLALAGVIFVWTPAHFYNLALAYREDYEAGGFPMMPVVRGETETRKHILWWLGATLVAAAGLIWLTPLGWLAAATTVALGGVFLATVVDLHREQTERAAFRAFHASNAYLGAVLLAGVVDSLVL
jgi:protoheme IX farnesyltransferase